MSARHRLSAALTLLVAGGVLAGTATAAHADPLAPAVGAVPVAPGVAAADNGAAGWGAQFPAANHVVTTTFTVPTVVCRPGSTIMSVGVTVTGTAVSDGNFDYLFGQVVVDCRGGAPVYTATVSTNPKTVSGAVAPGDELFVRLTATSTGKAYAVLTDRTSGLRLQAVDFGILATGLTASLSGSVDDQVVPRFTPVTFSQVQVDGRRLTVFKPYRFDEVSGGVTVATASALTGGQNFTVRRVAGS